MYFANGVFTKYDTANRQISTIAVIDMLQELRFTLFFILLYFYVCILSYSLALTRC